MLAPVAGGVLLHAHIHRRRAPEALCVPLLPERLHRGADAEPAAAAGTACAAAGLGSLVSNLGQGTLKQL